MIHGRIFVGDALLVVAIPETDDEKRTGLLNHLVITDDFGMLFDPAVPLHTFGMKFPIDVVWLSEDGDVVEIDECVEPCEELEIPEGAVRCIELAAGFARRNGLTRD